MLYEVTFQKYYADVDELLDPKTRQIPAESEWDACATLGQFFSSDDYELKVLKVVKVR